jgi:hypothetical protein
MPASKIWAFNRHPRNDDRNNYMTQLFQISRLVNFSSGWARQGGVLEGVADKPFFCIPSSPGSCFIATVR